MSERIQRKRTPGWRKPAGVIDCTRPGRWGNPFRVREYFYPEHVFVVLDKHSRFCGEPHADKAEANAAAVELFRDRILFLLMVWPEYLEPLRGKDLMCWCALTDENGQPVPCHADTLLALANQGVWVPDGGGV